MFEFRVSLNGTAILEMIQQWSGTLPRRLVNWITGCPSTFRSLMPSSLQSLYQLRPSSITLSHLFQCFPSNFASPFLLLLLLPMWQPTTSRSIVFPPTAPNVSLVWLPQFSPSHPHLLFLQHPDGPLFRLKFIIVRQRPQPVLIPVPLLP